jgi:hypothetical protein
MFLAQTVAAIAVGLPYPGGQTGAAFLAGPQRIPVDGLGFVRADSNAYWLVNSKGYVVKQFAGSVESDEVRLWLEGVSLPVGERAPDPRKTVVSLPKLEAVRTWMDVVGMGMRIAVHKQDAGSAADKGLLVMFLSSYGPVDHLYTERLNLVHAEAEKLGIKLLALFSGKEETIATVARFAALHEFKFACAVDRGNAFADAFRATRTPEVFLLGKGMQVVYTGAIDDSTFGGDAVRPYLLNAIRNYAGGRGINPTATRVFGTPIDR